MVEFDSGNGERATIQAVAARAGVSPTTVSLVLAGKGVTRRISEITHRRVQRAAEELNYAPNLGTRTLRGERTHILSFFSTYRNRDRGDLYMNSLSSAVEAAGGVEGYDILVHCNFERDPKQIYQFLNGGLADGLLLFAPRADDPLLALLRKSHLPVVIMNGRDPEGRYPSVADDVEQGMRLLVDAIVAEGHRHVAALFDDKAGTPDCDRRIALLEEGLTAHGIALAPQNKIPVQERAVAEALAALRSQPVPPTAVFCWHDRVAYALLAECEEQGVSVPGELSIFGYDGLHWPTRSGHVVTSARVDLDDLASVAVRLLKETILGPQHPATLHLRPVSLLRGTSSGRLFSATVH